MSEHTGSLPHRAIFFKRLLTFFLLVLVKAFALVFYRVHLRWIGTKQFDEWYKIKCIIFLNHTSLFEPLFIAPAPVSFLWHLAGHMVACGADVTLKRPLVGLFWRYFAPTMVSISRQRDHTWDYFIEKIQQKHSVVVMAAEGRMMRKNGLDKNAKPMSIRGGVVDVLKQLSHGDVAIVYSGGLHHVHAPGELFPRIFKDIYMSVERLNISQYLSTFTGQGELKFRRDLVRDLERRLRENRPIDNECT